MTDPDEADWTAIRHRYETTQDAVADICRDGGIDRSQLDRARKKNAWRRQNPRPFPAGRRTPPGPRAADTTQVGRKRAGPATPRHARPAAVGQAATGGTACDVAPAPTEAALPEGPSTRPAATKRRLPSTPAARRRLLDRLVAAISLKLEQLERQMTQSLDSTDAASTTATDHERETRAIGALIDNLEKITEMETGLRPSDAKHGKAAIATDLADEAERCRRELADRLSRLVEAAAKDA
jgi:hypothetical protein